VFPEGKVRGSSTPLRSAQNDSVDIAGIEKQNGDPLLAESPFRNCVG